MKTLLVEKSCQRAIGSTKSNTMGSGPWLSKTEKNVRLVSRNKKAFDYPQLLDALKLLPAGHFVLDDEIAALDEKGRSSFQLLQIFKSSGNVPLVYFAFDLLFLVLAGKDLRKEPLIARRKLLAKLLEKAPENIRLSGELRGSKDELSGLLKSMASRGWSPKDRIQSTKAARVAVPGSNSRSPRRKNSLSAAIHCLKEAGAILVPCSSATMLQTGSCSPAE